MASQKTPAWVKALKSRNMEKKKCRDKSATTMMLTDEMSEMTLDGKYEKYYKKADGVGVASRGHRKVSKEQFWNPYKSVATDGFSSDTDESITDESDDDEIDEMEVEKKSILKNRGSEKTTVKRALKNTTDMKRTSKNTTTDKQINPYRLGRLETEGNPEFVGERRFLYTWLVYNNGEGSPMSDEDLITANFKNVDFYSSYASMRECYDILEENPNGLILVVSDHSATTTPWDNQSTMLTEMDFLMNVHKLDQFGEETVHSLTNAITAGATRALQSLVDNRPDILGKEATFTPASVNIVISLWEERMVKEKKPPTPGNVPRWEFNGICTAYTGKDGQVNSLHVNTPDALHMLLKSSFMSFLQVARNEVKRKGIKCPSGGYCERSNRNVHLSVRLKVLHHFMFPVAGETSVIFPL